MRRNRFLILIVLMVFSVSGAYAQVSRTVECVAGKLSSLLTESERQNLTRLTIIGEMDKTDFETLRKIQSLQSLDIEKVTLAGYVNPQNPAFSEPANMLPMGAFQDSPNLISVTLPVSLTEVSDIAFRACGRLTNVRLGPIITRIGRSAFAECSNLTTVNLPEGLVEIGSYAFIACSKLYSLTLPSTLVKIGYGAFNGDDIKTLTSKAAIPPVMDNPYPDFEREGKIPTTLYVPTGKAEAYRNAYYWKDFATVTDTQPSTTVATPAPKPATTTSATTVAAKPAPTPNTPPTGVSKSVWIIVPSTLRNEFTDEDYDRVTRLTVSGAINRSDIGTITNFEHLEFLDLSEAGIAVSRVKVNSAVAFFGGDFILYYDEDTGYSTYPAYTICEYDFAEFYSLIEIILPVGLEAIHMYAFEYCENLETVRLPSSIEDFWEGAFRGCTNLKNVYIDNPVPPEITADVFEGVNKRNCTVYVPAGSVSRYKAAPVWREFNIVVKP